MRIQLILKWNSMRQKALFFIDLDFHKQATSHNGETREFSWVEHSKDQNSLFGTFEHGFRLRQLLKTCLIISHLRTNFPSCKSLNFIQISSFLRIIFLYYTIETVNMWNITWYYLLIVLLDHDIFDNWLIEKKFVCWLCQWEKCAQPRKGNDPMLASLWCWWQLKSKRFGNLFLTETICTFLVKLFSKAYFKKYVFT